MNYRSIEITSVWGTVIKIEVDDGGVADGLTVTINEESRRTVLKFDLAQRDRLLAWLRDERLERTT